ncbi:MAG: hypothetical protein R2702_05340 [Acidimicrobiales bacterium]
MAVGVQLEPLRRAHLGVAAEAPVRAGLPQAHGGASAGVGDHGEVAEVADGVRGQEHR